MEYSSKTSMTPSEETPLLNTTFKQKDTIVVAAQTAMREPSYGFDWTYVKRFCRLHRYMFTRFKSLSVLLLIALVGVCGLEQYLTFKIGLIPGQYYKCLGAKDYQQFLHITVVSVIVIVSMSVTKSLRVYVTNTMTVEWRRSLTKSLHCQYFHNRLYYDLNSLSHHPFDGKVNIDNPDQRIAADTSLFCYIYGTLVADLIVVPVSLGYYAYSAFTRTGWVGPTGMFGLFIVSSCVNKLLMSPVVRLTFKKERLEGDFRFKHVFVRTNSESLAFSGPKSEAVEHQDLNSQLLALCRTQQDLMTRQLVLDLATNTFDYFGSIASYMVIAVPIFSGAMDSLKPEDLSQAISENSFVCMYLIFNFSKLVDMSQKLSNMAGVTHRVSEIFERQADDHLAPPPPSAPSDPPPPSALLAAHTDNTIIRINSLDVVTPNGSTTLISNLSFDLVRNKSLLVTGRSSSGKTSLLRVIKGLWPSHSKSNALPVEYLTDEVLYYLPQRPLMSETVGTLRKLVTYPDMPTHTKEETDWIKSQLQLYGLNTLLSRVHGSLDVDPRDTDSSFHWSENLSPGETQILAFVRMFYHSPSLAILDEATSAVSHDVEEMLYAECVRRQMTFISVAHRDSVKKFHRQNLVLQGSEMGAKESTPLSS